MKQLVVGASAFAFAVAASPAFAQFPMGDVIGSTIGNSIARERACARGEGGPNEGWKAAEAAKLDDAVARYVKWSASANQSDARGLFSTAKDAGAAGADGVVTQLGSSIPALSMADILKRDQLVFSTDWMSARGLWTASSSGQIYAIDWLRGGWPARWKIWRVRAVAPDTTVSLPDRYCHAVELTKLW